MNEYPVSECITIHKTEEHWEILSNFAKTPLEVKEVMFESSDQLFQVLKFNHKEDVKEVYKSSHPKMTAKKLEILYRRTESRMIFIDVMKFCLQMKYEQSYAFRDRLAETKGKFILENQTTFRKPADALGVKACKNDNATSMHTFVGHNLLGRILMELRDRRNFGV